ncbi:ladinin-1 [Thalassophryne amazonica]|uniref:ladinin-1 n=1 Tax=Thalassophryne amazonica TaxID=390379 RepID=UPI001471A4F6|nr:ladinin-1 [Thalassophryne amazonica]
MSISRKNWSALSSLTRQWTMEDEEEVEREKRRRVRSSSSTADLDSESNQTAGDTPTADGTRGTDGTNEVSLSPSSQEQLQLDFVEMLRLRDEKRRLRHVEALRRQKEKEEVEAGVCTGGESRARMDEGGAPPSVSSTSKPEQSVKATPHSPTSTTLTDTQHKSDCSPGGPVNYEPPSSRTRKFVSSVSISLDRTPSVSECSTPMSPRSPTDPFYPQEHWPSPCQSPTPAGTRSPAQSQQTQEAGVNGSSASSEQTPKPALIRKSSRTVSFRMMRKKEEHMAFQRSASVRMASKKFESNMDQNQEDKPPSFQRNSRQRVSSRSIQEKMERLSQAAQKSEMPRSPDVTQRTLVLHDAVSRKRDLYEQKASSPTSPGVSKQEFRSFSSGVSERINRWISKASQHGSSHISRDMKHVDISSKRSLFETEDNTAKANNKKFHT